MNPEGPGVRRLDRNAHVIRRSPHAWEVRPQGPLPGAPVTGRSEIDPDPVRCVLRAEGPEFGIRHVD